jgi:hypothetical protein
MTQPSIMYYRARPDLTVQGLPIFFGQVELRQGQVVGRHYRARIDQNEHHYLIGYYQIEQEAEQFLKKFADHGDVEISEAEFEALLAHWKQESRSEPFCWNPEDVL